MAVVSTSMWFKLVHVGFWIPKINCFLNGIDLPWVVYFWTLLDKVAGFTFLVAMGLAVGKEVLMVHSEAVVVARISQGRTKFLGADTKFFQI